MNKDIDVGGPAFPVTIPTGESYNGHAEFDGMTLRDYFAAKAMQGLLSGFYSGTTSANCLEVPEEAYRIADGMIEARKQ